jgi:hypothetical protein
VQSNKTSHKTKQFIIFLKGMLCKAVCVRGDGIAIKCFLHSMLETIDAFNFNILWALGKKPLKFGCGQESSEGI